MSAAIFLITACAFCRPACAAQPAYTVSQKRKRGPDGETLGEWAKKLALKFKRDCDEGGGQLYGGNLTEALRVATYLSDRPDRLASCRGHAPDVTLRRP